MVDRLTDKGVIVTGGGNGIGRASALMFAAEGAFVTVADHDVEAAQRVCAEIGDASGQAIPAAVDVSSEESVVAMVDVARSAGAPLSGLLNCAGGGSTADGPVTELGLEEFWRTMRIDLFGTLLCCRSVIPEMVRAGGGSIVNISSLRAIIGTEGQDAYTASKGGVLAMSRAMAVRWAREGIRVNVMAPGVILTERVAAFIKPDHPLYQKSLLGPGEPGDVANLATFLVSDESRLMTGAVVRLDGGASAC